MKKIEAIIRTEKVEALRERLSDIGVCGMTLYQVMGLGRQKGYTEIYRGVEHKIDFLNKVKLEIVVAEDILEQTLDIITAITRTGRIGDGKIFVSTIDEVIRIRTGETGTEAM